MWPVSSCVEAKISLITVSGMYVLLGLKGWVLSLSSNRNEMLYPRVYIRFSTISVTSSFSRVRRLQIFQMPEFDFIGDVLDRCGVVVVNATNSKAWL